MRLPSDLSGFHVLLKNVLLGIFVSLGAHELLGEALMLFDVRQEVVNHFTLLHLFLHLLLHLRGFTVD
jgi:hypothetical protein